MSTVFAKIQMRRGTASEWAAANPILAQGEFAFETDTGVTRVGDGATRYETLPAYATYDQMIAAQDAIEAGQAQLSVIKGDGTVFDITTARSRTIFLSENKLVYQRDADDDPIHIRRVDDLSSAYYDIKRKDGSAERPQATASNTKVHIVAFDEGADLALGYEGGLDRVLHKPGDNGGSMALYTTSVFITGWLPGDIKGAFRP